MVTELSDQKRKFGGRIYHYDNGFPQKHRAETWAEHIRSHGGLARVVKDPVDQWYNIFKHERKR